MLPHGYGKLMMLISGNEISFPKVFGLPPVVGLVLAIFAEFICSVLIIIGFRTRLSSIPLAITMAVAAFIIHFGDPFSKKELALLYLVAYVALILLGGGKYAVKRD